MNPDYVTAGGVVTQPETLDWIILLSWNMHGLPPS